MRITIVAVTNAFKEYCVAGITDDGRWVRPIPGGVGSRFWRRKQLELSDGHFISTGDMFVINGNPPVRFQHPNHTEDFVVTHWHYVGKRNNNQLMQFLKEHCEDESVFLKTVNGQRRSLCLVQVNHVDPWLDSWDPTKVKMSFQAPFDVSNPKTSKRDYRVKDCKWERLILNRYALPEKWNTIYLCIGLATAAPFNGVEYPQVIGLHTDPYVQPPSTYPD